MSNSWPSLWSQYGSILHVCNLAICPIILGLLDIMSFQMASRSCKSYVAWARNGLDELSSTRLRSLSLKHLNLRLRILNPVIFEKTVNRGSPPLIWDNDKLFFLSHSLEFLLLWSRSYISLFPRVFLYHCRYQASRASKISFQTPSL